MVLNKQLWLCLLLLCNLFFPSAVKAGLTDTVKVKLFSAQKPATKLYLNGRFVLQPSQRPFAGHFEIYCQQGILSLLEGNKVLYKAPSLVLKVSDANGLGLSLNKTKEHFYEGQLSISQTDNCKLKIINEIETYKYVSAVVGSETGPNWPIEALKAQAVLTQTRLAKYKGQTLLDSTENEVYYGVPFYRPEAIKETWGQILTYDARPAEVYYHSTCAGHTAKLNYFQGGQGSVPNYLKGVKCDFCKTSPFWKVTRRKIDRHTFENVFGGLPKVLSKDQTGRPLQIQFKDHSVKSGYRFWLKLGNSFGWNKAPGSIFSIERDTSGAYWVSSRGAGHGVGLCQWGAAEQAKSGRSYTEILEYYFPGTRVKSIE